MGERCTESFTPGKTFHAQVESKYISKDAPVPVLESLNKVTSLLMYLLSICACRVGVGLEVHSHRSVAWGIPSFTVPNLRAFHGLCEIASEKTRGTVIFPAKFFRRKSI